jgi:hypothetical protein
MEGPELTWRKARPLPWGNGGSDAEHNDPGPTRKGEQGEAEASLPRQYPTGPGLRVQRPVAGFGANIGKIFVVIGV